MTHSDDFRRRGLEETVATSRDLRRTRVGRTERGGSVAAGTLLGTAACNVDAKRTFLCTFRFCVGMRLHRAMSISPTRGAGGFPENISDIVDSTT